MARVHPTALVDPAAELAGEVEVGPYAIVGPKVRIGAGSTVGAHAVISGRTTIGSGNRIFAHAALGGEPQDKKYAGEDAELQIGNGNTIREFCTFNIGTAGGGGVTRIGSDNWIMAYVHVAHDCRIGDHCVIANAVTFAGHVTIGDRVLLGGLTAIHQFCRVGDQAMTGGGSILLQDLPPFVICNGNPAAAHGLNSEGLKRRGFSADTISALRRAYRVLYRDGLTAAEACGRIDAMAAEAPESAVVLRQLADFVRGSGRGIVR
jgi:UDP-N-acetylglucosamine acyltransferase